MAAKLTEDLVKAAAGPDRGNRIHYDDAVPGFGLRVTAAGAKAFVLNYVVRGRERRATIGAWPTWSVKAAREEARSMRRAVDVGEDPMARRDADRAAETVAQLGRRYLDEHAAGLRPKTASEYESMVRVYVVPQIGALRVTALARQDVRRLHDEIKARYPVRANRVVSLVAAMVDWSGERPGDNPAAGIRLVPEEKRERFLSHAEIERLGAALEALPDRRSADALRLLLATGARKMEVLGATWREVDLSARTWTKPAKRMKAKRTHSVPLAASAVELLGALREEALAEGRPAGPADYVLPGAGAAGHLGDVKRAWRRATEQAGLGQYEDVTDKIGRRSRRWVADARVHDLRHTFASLVATQSRSLPIVAQLLGHSRLSSAQRYAHLADTALREAVDKAGGTALRHSRRRSGDGG